MWKRKCDVNEKLLPTPTQIISTEEFVPLDQTEDQKKVEHKLIEISSENSKKLGISRQKFLATSGGMAAAFPALNSVFGHFFDVDESEFFAPKSSDEKCPKKQFIFDIHTHHVGSGKIIEFPALLQYREVGARPSNTQYGWIYK